MSCYACSTFLSDKNVHTNVRGLLLKKIEIGRRMDYIRWKKR